MKELNMSIYTGSADTNKVMCTAVFETHEEAVAFHRDMAALCNKHSTPEQKPQSIFTPRWKLKSLTSSRGASFY